MMANSNTKTMTVKEEVEHSTAFAEDASRDEHVAIKTDTYAVDAAALGEHLPQHYYRSVGFIGTVIVSGRSTKNTIAANLGRHYVLVILATTLVGSCRPTHSP